MGSEPVDRRLDSGLLVMAHQVHAVVGFPGPEYRDLCDSVPVGYEVLDEEAAKSVGGSKGIHVPVIVVGTYLC